MAQETLQFNGVTVDWPDEDGYKVALATTSTEDSTRDMSLTMHNTPIGTVVSIELKWSDIKASAAARILRQVLNKGSFTCHYFDLIDGAWRTDTFYAANYNAPAMCLKDGSEVWDELSFKITKIISR